MSRIASAFATKPSRTRKVFDSNCLQSEALKAYLSASADNYVVLTDYAAMSYRFEPTIYGRNTIPVTWGQVQAQLADSCDKIEVITANGKSKTDIDYDAYKETGRSLIAIGGDKLSRGLTLEGLSVSYFLRVSRQYDSLLQMGRWFGYRRGFADLCRLYTTPDTEDWFRYVATAQKELRAQFFDMSLTRATLKEFGLKVAVHDVLEITAKEQAASHRTAPEQLRRRRQGTDGHVPRSLDDQS